MNFDQERSSRLSGRVVQFVQRHRTHLALPPKQSKVKNDGRKGFRARFTKSTYSTLISPPQSSGDQDSCSSHHSDDFDTSVPDDDLERRHICCCIFGIICLCTPRCKLLYVTKSRANLLLEIECWPNAFDASLHIRVFN